MTARLFALSLLTAALVSFARGADEENPYKKAKVGDFATYKLTTKVGTFNVDGTITQTVTARDDKEVTFRVTGKVNNQEIPPQELKLDVTKPFDPTKVLAVGGSAAPTKVGEGKEKVTVAGKSYDARWEAYKVKLSAQGMDLDADMKVWRVADLALPVVKVEMGATVTDAKIEMGMELEGAGHKEPEKAPAGKDAPKKDAPPKKDVKKDKG
jgi:hypothetical protein